MNTGEHRWRIPVGRGELLPAIQRLGVRERLGFLARSWALVALPANATGAPITYMVSGKQYIAFPVGGGPLTEELIAVSL